MQEITRNILGEEVTVYWNYRLMRRVDGAGTNFEEENLYVVEVYYDADNKLIGWTEEKSVYGENIAEIRQTLEWMLEALNKPVLVEVDLLAEADRAREVGRSDTFSEEAFKPVEVGKAMSKEELIEYLDAKTDAEEHATKTAPNLLQVEPKTISRRVR